VHIPTTRSVFIVNNISQEVPGSGEYPCRKICPMGGIADYPHHYVDNTTWHVAV